MKEIELHACCHGMQNLLRTYEERGHAVLVRINPEGGFRFYLQSRGVSKGGEEKLVANVNGGIVNVSSHLGFRYCPFC